MMRWILEDLNCRKRLVESAIAYIRFTGYEPSPNIQGLAERFANGELTASEFKERCEGYFISTLRLLLNESDTERVRAMENLLAQAEATGECHYETRAFGSFRLCFIGPDHFVLAQKQSATPQWPLAGRGSNYNGFRNYLIEQFERLGPVGEHGSR